MLFDLIDDTLLSLNLEFESYREEDKSGWIEDFFRGSLAFIQANHFKEINENNILALLKARNYAVLKMAGDPTNWRGLVSSSVPLRSGLFIKQEIEQILKIFAEYQNTEQKTGDLIEFLNNIESIISKFPSRQFKEEMNFREFTSLREHWMSGKSISIFNEKVLKAGRSYFGYKLPWAINAIARMLSTVGLEEECKTFEELAVLVQVGLPNMLAVNIYLCGIHSRVAATELSGFFNEGLKELSLRSLRKEIIKVLDSISGVSEKTKEWMEVFKSTTSNSVEHPKRIPAFKLKSGIDIKSSILFVKEFKEEYYLCSPDFNEKIKIKQSERFPFNEYSNNFGVYFERTSSGFWKMRIRNPFLKYDFFDFLDI
ncbi:hypothetical protein [Rossellomorea aquimaris]|uniref:hypothetical protein n=1 Tax=Rossellomorea TaxID=2837508 RepID=UPI0021CC5DB5|nr:hypothetical protein [Rossellomorea aquimaris]